MKPCGLILSGALVVICFEAVSFANPLERSDNTFKPEPPILIDESNNFPPLNAPATIGTSHSAVSPGPVGLINARVTNWATPQGMWSTQSGEPCISQPRSSPSNTSSYSHCDIGP